LAEGAYLLLGESMCEWQPGMLTPDIVRTLIGRDICGERPHRFCTIVYQTVTGRKKKAQLDQAQQ
jgi:hypothetical protein